MDSEFWLVDVPRRCRSSVLRCKRRLNFDDITIVYKGRSANGKDSFANDTTIVYKRRRANCKDSCAYDDRVLILGSGGARAKSEEEDESKGKKRIDEAEAEAEAAVVVGPQTPLPAKRKSMCCSSSSRARKSKSKGVIKLMNDKLQLQQVSELAEKSHYYTRSINKQLLSTIQLSEGRGGVISASASAPKKTWRGLMRTAIAQSCGTSSDENDSLFLGNDGKVRLFIRKVGDILGQRTYSPWKGSVLDSIVGVFLAQRVGDNLSSSAFMSLGVRFPQPRDCDAYSRHHRILRVKRSNAAPSCQKRDMKILGADEAQKPFNNKKKETLRKGRIPRTKILPADWKALREQYSGNMGIERHIDSIDYVDWHAVMRAKVKDISLAIQPRGMNEKLAKRIKECLDLIMDKLDNLDLEWIRNLPPPLAKDFLLSIFGLGLKSAQCVQLLSLKQPAFPVDVNVGRVAVRLGWVPAPPDSTDRLTKFDFEEESALHNLISQYLWPRLCKHDQKTLYELHYLMITFGKVFCTKKPNCFGCPMKGQCAYFAETDVEDVGGIAPTTPSKVEIRRSQKQTRTQHFVLELPDWHPILEKFDDRDPDDSSPYLLVIWESAQHEFDDSGNPLAKSTSSSLTSTTGSLTVPGTVMIPYRTALRGNFPLNGTYFQTNEVFADQQTTRVPIDVRRKTLQQLPKKTLYCGSDISNIVKGLSADEVKSLFNEGYVCTRGFNRETGASVALDRRLHVLSQSKKQ